MKRVFFLALAAIAWHGCSQQEDIEMTEDVTGEKSVTLNVTQSLSQSKGINQQIGDNEYAVIGSGKLYFCDVTGTAIYKRELTTSEVTALANDKTSNGGNSVTITGVPNTATMVYFVANTQTAAAPTHPQVYGTISNNARLRIDQLQSEQEHVPMAGLSDDFTPVTPGVYTTNIELTPLLTRLEIAQVTCQNQDGPEAPAVSTDITSYKLSGIFINDIHESVLLGGGPYPVGGNLDIKSQTGWGASWATFFTTSNTVFPYAPLGSPAAPTDWVAYAMSNMCTPGNSGLSFYPDETVGSTTTAPADVDKPCWGYFLVPSTTPTTGSAYDLPDIILKLTDVEYQETEIVEPIQYVTVTKYKDESGNAIDEFKRGNVYRITNLTFTNNQATDQPYQENITVTATVTVAKWVINDIEPDWN